MKGIENTGLIRHEINTELSPVQLYTVIRNKFRDTAILESMNGPSKMATQSILCFEPEFKLEFNDRKVYELRGSSSKQVAPNFEDGIEYMRSKLARYDIHNNDNNFCGGFLGFTSYDIIRRIEKIPDKRMKAEYPDAVYGFYTDAIVYDHIKGSILYIATSSEDDRFSVVQKIIQEPPLDYPAPIVTDFSFDTSKTRFMENVRMIKNKIVEGEVFQTVISQSCSFQLENDQFGLYDKIREINPSPHMYCLEFDDLCIIGSSPELLLAKEADILTTYPIAGTRPMGTTEDETKKYERELLNDEKEIAEHNMLVDLARNDIGKVSQLGSVKIPQYFQAEHFSHVMHIVSKVTGEIGKGLDQFDAFFALFPAGTVSGAPKIRSMELIEEYEQKRRGPYAGAVGYFDFAGNMVQAITIRTIFGVDKQFKLQAGAGIVYDSDPENEFYETINKMNAFLKIIQTEEQEL